MFAECLLIPPHESLPVIFKIFLVKKHLSVYKYAHKDEKIDEYFFETHDTVEHHLLCQKSGRPAADKTHVCI